MQFVATFHYQKTSRIFHIIYTEKGIFTIPKLKKYKYEKL